jgi:hypothetical protein
MGLRNSTSKPTLRVRAGGGGVLTQSSNKSHTTFLDVFDFPRDGASHTVVVEILTSPLQVFPFSAMAFAVHSPYATVIGWH